MGQGVPNEGDEYTHIAITLEQSRQFNNPNVAVALVLQPQFRRLKTDGYFQPTTPACFHDHYNDMCLQMRMRRIAKDLRDSEGAGASILGVITLRDYTGFGMVVSTREATSCSAIRLWVLFVRQAVRDSVGKSK